MEKTGIMSFALALLLFAGSAFASVNPKVQLQNYSLSEVPGQPGHVLELEMFFKSVEPDNCAERVAVQLSVSYPLSVRGPDTQYVDLLCYRDLDSKGTLKFYLPIDNLAASGTYAVSVSTTYEKRFTKLSESNTLNVQVGGAPSFAASVSSSAPVDIYPGDSATVTIAFQNTGSSLVQSARATAESQGIEVKWAGRIQEIGKVSARGSATAAFSIEAPKDLPAGNYPLSVRLDYAGEDRSNGSAQFSFIVPVKPRADFAASAADGGMLPGQKREVTIALSNTGGEEARKVEVRIKPMFPFSTDGTVRYIDSLPAGETRNLTYVITVDKDASSGGQLLGVLLDFENPQGKKFADSADFAMQVRMPDLFEEITSYWYVVAAIVVAAAVFVSRSRKKKNPS